MKLYVLSLGKLVMLSDNPVTTAGGGGEEPPAIPIHAFLLAAPEKKILFDTGCVPDCMNLWPPALRGNPYVEEPGGGLLDRLAQIGVRPEEIGTVVLSHLHLDHAGGVHLFPNAEVLVQKDELETVMDRYAKGNLGMFHLPGDVENWTNVRWQTVEEQETVLCPGVTVLNLGPGHSYGMLALEAELNSGNVLLASDAVYSAAHFGPPARLSGAVENEAGYFAAVDFLRTRAKARHARILYGHDMAQFRALVKSTEGYLE